MLANNPDRDWERFGADDPYFGVLTETRYRRSELTEESLTAFFRSGEEYLDRIAELCRRAFGVDPAPARALDFGCGVGRVTLALASRAREVVGVDVSSSMLREAERNREHRQAGNVRFIQGDDQLSQVSGTFDFIHSYIVFQHIPTARGEAITRRMLDMLQEDGLGALHYTHSVTAPPLARAWLWAKVHVPLFQQAVGLLRRGRPAPLMQMNEYSLTRIVGLLQEHGCEEIFARTTRHGTAVGAMLVFRKRRLPSL